MSWKSQYSSGGSTGGARVARPPSLFLDQTEAHTYSSAIDLFSLFDFTFYF